MSEPSTGDAVEQDWQRWWDNLPDNVRQKITDYEKSLGTKLAWNQRYLLVTRRR